MIDAVVTWVDGDDPRHRRRRAQFQDGGVEGLWREALDTTRFRSRGEIYYCLHLLRKNAPWLRTVFLVTDGQCPEFLSPAEASRLGVRLVDHSEIFSDYEEVLPTFNSLSIETMIHRIPGLSERFIYLNDDFFVIRPVVPEDFFSNGQALWRGVRWPGNPWAFRLVKKLRRLRKRLGHRWHVDGLVGLFNERTLLRGSEHLQVAHAPYPLTRSTLEALLNGRLSENMRYRFRHVDQFNPIALAANEGWGNGEVRLAPRDWGYLDCKKESGDLICRKMARFVEDPAIRMVCVQSMDQADPETASQVTGMLGALLSEDAPRPLQAGRHQAAS